MPKLTNSMKCLGTSETMVLLRKRNRDLRKKTKEHRKHLKEILDVVGRVHKHMARHEYYKHGVIEGDGKLGSLSPFDLVEQILLNRR